MIPHMSSNDLLMFYKYLNNTKIYFEYGSGGSTYQASIRSNIQKIYTVESDLEWINNLKKIIINNNITFLFNDMVQNQIHGDILDKIVQNNNV